jgi:hypothetical protein
MELSKEWEKPYIKKPKKSLKKILYRSQNKTYTDIYVRVAWTKKSWYFRTVLTFQLPNQKATLTDKNENHFIKLCDKDSNIQECISINL